MTKPRSRESMMIRKFGWIVVALLAASVAACGGSTQTTGTAPSVVAPIGASTETGGNLGLLKEGKGKGHLGTPPTAPEPGDAVPDLEEGHGHGNASIQYEGFVERDSIQGDCTAGLTIPIDDVTVTTDEMTEFQRARCDQLLASTGSIHFHIAAKYQEKGLVATYVRMQGPKGDDGDEEEDTTPTTETTTN